MKWQTALKKILQSDSSDAVKESKLWRLAARQVPHSPAQEEIKKHWTEFHSKVYGR